MRICSLCLLLLLVWPNTSCTYRDLRKEPDPVTGYDTGPYDQPIPPEVKDQKNEYFWKTDKGKLTYAKAAQSDGNYKLAIQVLMELLSKENLDDEIKEEALYLSGRVYSTLLNPGRDDQKSAYYLKWLLRQYPASRFRVSAEQILSRTESRP